MIRAIVFDFDGVLVDSVHIKTKAFEKLFKNEEEEKVQQFLAFHKKHGGVSREEKVRYFYSNILRRSLSESLLHALCEQFREAVVDRIVSVDWVEGTTEAIKEIKGQGILTMIVSGTPEDELKMIVCRKKAETLFDEIFGSPHTKPQLLNKILKKYGLESGEVMYLGDSLSDHFAAQEVGVHFIAGCSVEMEEPCQGLNVPTIPNLMSLSHTLQAMGLLGSAEASDALLAQDGRS